MKQKLGEMMHHDTITGTSPLNVIMQETQELLRVRGGNNVFISRSISKLGKIQGLELSNIQQCLKDVNDRKLCNFEERDINHLFAYNPSIFVQRYSTFTLARDTYEVKVWDDVNREFKSPKSLEVFCEINYDIDQECDYVVGEDVYPFSGKVFKFTNS